MDTNLKWMIEKIEKEKKKKLTQEEIEITIMAFSIGCEYMHDCFDDVVSYHFT